MRLIDFMAIKFPFLIEVPKRHAVCLLGQEPFTPGMEYCSVLVETAEMGEFQRKDYCLSCWEREGKISDDNAAYWKAKVPKHPLKGATPLITYEEKAMELFKAAAKTSGEEEEAFILALWLIRKRKLVLRHCFHEKNGQEVNLYEDPLSEETFPIRKVHLEKEKVLDLQSKLSNKLRS
ncbi:putative uncharacterized protein [Parachlamydia acanthamoebae UV-7]|uniref:Uncharacterized protein n=3 Tax=Parachlamydia acanthamoebae TaxID=83552 RepID=F8KYB4_PARAV|nr:hypothetical protein [Parachlamydia acanthamoebae]KIA78447.1 hypothetical protein DB43_DZ00340 [Parachlamydia acanthamoebae]CCB85849.1 putative uncharacterized protein [Parachlamydia acanthamoebae UV-7]